MAQAHTTDRPLSPHLQVWRWHVTMATSILHRVTGVVLYLGAIGLVVWLTALSAGREAYEGLMTFIPAWAIEVKIYAVTAVLAFHLANGVRHFAFDLGAGFKPRFADATAWLAIVFAAAAPAGLFALIHGAR